MPELIAQGRSSGQRWCREVPDATNHRGITIGRSGADWDVPWDSMISRAHIRLTAMPDDRVEIQRLPTARNPVFHGGRQVDQFTLVPGEHFVIGHTTFTLASRAGSSHTPNVGDVTEHAFDLGSLRRQKFRDANQRIDALTKLPDLITGSSTEQELLVRLTGVLLTSTPAATDVAIVCYRDPSDEAKSGLRILHRDSRVPGREQPPISSRLVRAAVSSRESRLHLWSSTRKDAVAFTASEEVDWAFCVPIRSDACAGWAFYVAGQTMAPLSADPDEQAADSTPQDLGDDVKFAELVGTMLGNLRKSLRLERRQSAMRSFFAPVVMDALANREVSEVLAPRETELAVMFCDLRGFSRQSEQASDRLLELLDRVSNALGVMTHHILRQRGVIGDFHGDAAMGFWGWPLDQPDRQVRAALAALLIWRHYAADTNQSGFRCGIGIASGRAVAGRIGTTDQVKVTAFGPVVNLASRLEGMTKVFGAEVLLDQTTAEALSTATPGSFGTFRLRRLATVRPAGMNEPLQISQLLGTSDDGSLQESVELGVDSAVTPIDSPGQQDGSDSPSSPPTTLTDDDIRNYEQALDRFVAGDWDETYQLLHALPAWDRPKDVLLSVILRHNRVPPADWDGVIDLPK
ncbi:adenylate/guanylate cyclase domain-containing protein [Crateriforma spongiae]|uniref:adenylate/guanylate cyclase domain-containing protein n=1 Tax=Crateriforma spongiae TaxID=2724528 RepID=UPI0014479C65|nr:adenylate/guanylate cyclase domain-containing protein [Crateriforma spongiae]